MEYLHVILLVIVYSLGNVTVAVSLLVSVVVFQAVFPKVVVLSWL